MSTNGFKKSFLKTLLVVFLFLITLSAVSCGSKGPVADTSDLDIANFEYGFIEENDYEEGSTKIKDTQKSTQLSADTIYYCIMEFDIFARELNKGLSLVNIEVAFDNLDVANGTTEEATTGNVTEMTFTDAGTGKQRKVATHAYKIPPDPDEAKKIRLVVRIQPVSIGDSCKITINFQSQTAGEFEVYGNDGITKNLEVVRAQLTAPKIKVDRDRLRVTWDHVENADYYIIQFENQSIEYRDISADAYTGAELSFDLSEFSIYGIEYGAVKIIAASDNPNFAKSKDSNIEYDIFL